MSVCQARFVPTRGSERTISLRRDAFSLREQLSSGYHLIGAAAPTVAPVRKVTLGQYFCATMR